MRDDSARSTDPEADRLWVELVEAKRRYEAALAAYLDHHDLAASPAA